MCLYIYTTYTSQFVILKPSVTMERSGLRFLLVVCLFPCVYSRLQPALAAAEHALGDALDALMDARSSSEKQCSRCEGDADPDCVPHILTKLTDEVSVLENKVSRLQSQIQCSCPCRQVPITEGREPGFILMEQSEGKWTGRVLDPTGTLKAERSLSRFSDFYYNPFTERILTSYFRSFNMTFEDEQTWSGPTATKFTIAGDPYSEMFYVTDTTKKVWKVGMDGKFLEELVQLQGVGTAATIDLCKGTLYIAARKTIKSVNVEGVPQIEDVGETTDYSSYMDIDTEAQKLYHCSTGQVYVFDLVAKTDAPFVTSGSSDCDGLKVWNGFVYVIHRQETSITKISIEGRQSEKIKEGIFSSTSSKLFSLF